MAGHVAGDTVIEIKGQNMGRNASNIEQIIVDGVECLLVPGTYVPASQYVVKGFHGGKSVSK